MIIIQIFARNEVRGTETQSIENNFGYSFPFQYSLIIKSPKDICFFIIVFSKIDNVLSESFNRPKRKNKDRMRTAIKI